VTSRSKTVSVAVVVGKELLQDVMLVVADPFEQSFIGVLGELGRSGVTVATQTELNTSTDECFDALFVGGGGEPPVHQAGEAKSSLARTTALYISFSASLHIPCECEELQ